MRLIYSTTWLEMPIPTRRFSPIGKKAKPELTRSTTEMASYRFSKSMRLLRASDFERVFAGQVLAGDLMLIVYGAANELGHARLGLTVSRKLGRAVFRNRWKRVVRE